MLNHIEINVEKIVQVAKLRQLAIRWYELWDRLLCIEACVR